jgi:7-keto-8-aminopelargonate synthetase-like enzyme
MDSSDHQFIRRILQIALATLAIITVILIFISQFAAKISFFILIKVILLKFVMIHYGWDKQLENTKVVKKFKFLWKMKKIKTQAKSINQAMTLLAKNLLNLPIEENEDEVKSYLDIKNLYGENWPFMVPVRRTRDPQVTVQGKKVECISSYSYLDLCRNEEIQEAAINATKDYSSGNHGPRMLCGNLEILESLEKRLAKFLNKESSLVFSSGYLACMSCVAGVARKGDMLLMDKLCHASLKSGAKLSGANIVTFRHNDFKDAENKIKSHKYKNLIMVIEGVYSMDGDIGNLPEARIVADKYKALLILDEAHSLGAIGKTGRGTEEFYNYKVQADIVCGSFTKSLASVGGYIACSKNYRDFYTFYGQGVVFSAPLSAYHAGAADKALEIIENHPELVTKLQENSTYLRDKFRENKFDIGDSCTCVVPVIFRDTIQCLAMHRWLLNNGYFTSLVMAPACSLTAPRYRITASSSMNKEEMDRIVDIFIKARDAVKENKEMIEMLEELKI